MGPACRLNEQAGLQALYEIVASPWNSGRM